MAGKIPAVRAHLLVGASATALGLMLSTMSSPAEAQLARLRASIGVTPTITPPAQPTAIRPPNMREALNRQVSNFARAEAMRGVVTAARDAAQAAVRANPTDGLSANGLDPVAGAVQAALDTTGTNTWQGASGPTQTVDSSGRVLVSIDQNESRALLSWNRFDIGANTTLQFNQRQNGVARPDWVVLNRVVGSTAPSTILGSIKADGSVLVLNQRGVIFGKGAQVNVNSLLASTLEIGNFARDPALGTPDAGNMFTGLTLKERNTAFLQNGLLGESATATKFAPMLTSSLAGDGVYNIAAPEAAFSAVPEGDVVIDRGASINAAKGGYVIITAPNIKNDGALSAPEGQVSLQAGRAVSYTVSTGGENSVDRDVRGLILRSTSGSAGTVENSGLIDVPRGYISLGAGLDGSVTNSGLLSSTTSVSRNGKISLTAGTVTISGASEP